MDPLQDEEQLYLVQVKRHVLTEIPVEVTVVLTRIVEATKHQMKQFRRAFKEACVSEEASDIYHSLAVTEIASCERWTIGGLQAWLEEFKKD